MAHVSSGVCAYLYGAESVHRYSAESDAAAHKWCMLCIFVAHVSSGVCAESAQKVMKQRTSDARYGAETDAAAQPSTRGLRAHLG